MYDHKKLEEEILKFWEKNDIYKKVKEKCRHGEPFYFCDGPPYATGQIHPGTAWNKTIKDAYCRYWRARGRDLRAQAGYDTHGLPIEVKVEQELKFKNKSDIEKYGIGKFIDKCKAFATKYIDVMGNQFRTIGVWMDFDKPYITYHDDYIESSWTTLKMAWDKGLMHEGIYVLPYCYRCETTMANYELEYGEETDPSIYVKFKVKDKDNEYMIIWTTTPWTLIANMGVMVHPTETYVKAQVGNEVWVVAKQLLDPLMEKINQSATVLEELPGRKLNNIQYEHPFQDKIPKQYDRKVVLSDEYVTVEEGTGLVHTAPGTGPEDFIIGKRYDIEPFCPVDGKGCYTKEAGEMFVGKNVRAANPEIIELIRNNGTLIAEQRVKHRYPHCWRCKTPLIFITTNQWFISISKIKDQMLNEIDHTEWHPNFAKDRFKEFVRGAPDWCISRQRYWGIPLPIWRCGCGEVKVFGSREGLPTVKELHRPYVDEIELDCKCGKKMKRIRDVLDVWFDSGNAIWAPLSKEDAKRYSNRTDLIIEGQDQIRGWFYSLLGSGVVRYGACPYKRLIMHGHFVDEHGEKMSKSLGNFIPLEEVLAKYGADSFRLWGMSNTVWDELKFSWVEMKKCSSDLNILLNLVVFMERFYSGKKKKDIHPEYKAEDKWMISRLNSTLKAYREAMEGYEIHKAVKALRCFIVDDLSRFYMKLAKERVSRGDNADEVFRVIYECMLAILGMLSPISPFISEYLFQRFFRKYEAEESLSMRNLLDENDGDINVLLEKQIEIVKELTSTALLARQTAGIKVRWPMRTLYIETKSHEIIDAINAFGNSICMLVNVKEIKTVDQKPSSDIVSQEFNSGSVHISKKIDEELYEEGIVNEIKRRIQNLRKEENLLEKDLISVSLDTDKELETILKKHKDKLLGSVNADRIEFGVNGKVTEYTIDGRLVKLAIKKK